MQEPQTTQILIRRVQSGDQTALEELCDRYLARVLSAVRIRLGAKLRRKVESSDIVQDVMVDALRKIESFEFRSEGAFLKYLNEVVQNRIRDEADYWSAQKRAPDREVGLQIARSPDSSIPFEIGMGASVPTPSKIVSLGEDLAILERAIDRIGEQSQEYRELIVAVKIEGRSFREIAEEDGKTPDAVRMQFNRAMAALAKAFQELSADGGEPRNGRE